jgi:signal peptidase I
MQLDFAAVLVIAAVVTGAVWLLDALLLAPKRARVAFSEGSGKHSATPGLINATAKMPWYIDFSRSFFPVIVAVLILRSFIVEPFRIPSGSMEPTLLPGDFILVNKFSYGLRLPVLNNKIIDLGEPERGDVVVFRYPEDPSIAFIKRIVGLPGDKLEYRDKQLYINDKPITQEVIPRSAGDNMGITQFIEYLGENGHQMQIMEGRPDREMKYEVPEGQYFAMGDNRDNSRDSRVWGTLPEQNLIGKAFLIWMNWDCITFNGHCSRIGSTIE